MWPTDKTVIVAPIGVKAEAALAPAKKVKPTYLPAIPPVPIKIFQVFELRTIAKL